MSAIEERQAIEAEDLNSSELIALADLEADLENDTTIEDELDLGEVEDESKTRPRLLSLVSPLPRPSPLPPPPRIPSFAGCARALPPVPKAPSRPPAKAPSSCPPPKAPPSYPPPVRLPSVVARPDDTETRPIIPRPRPPEMTRQSYPTFTTSILPRTHTRRVLKMPLPIAVGALAGVALFLLALFVSIHRMAPSAGRSGEALVVTASGPGSRPVTAVDLFVDGSRRCEATPCRIGAIDSGLHFVSIAAQGYAATAARVVEVRSGEPAAVHFDLLPEPASVAAPAPKPAQSEALALTATMLPAEPANPVSLPAEPLPVRPAPVKPTQGVAILNLNSIPLSSVLVDGRPLGQTPKLDVRVKPGPHQIVFVHPEHGRRAQSIELAAGERQTVAVRF